VSDYRTVNSQLGTTKDLEILAEHLSAAGINLVLDFVFNHTSDEHEWAEQAKNGNPEFQDYYWMFDNQDVPNQYEEHLREIFPQVRRGNFTYNDASHKWVWTTFNSFQWDLNYSNPAVFTAITSEMLFLANLGCDALRLDALAFIWKEMGTNCENQPKAHALIKAFNRCLKIVAPGVVFKSEAIVHPDEVLKYIDKDECELSYNPLLMALLWNSLATRETNLLTASMQKSFAINPDCAWVNYARCHDDIGWTFDDNVASALGIDSHNHRRFLNQFYTGKFAGSFAKGVAFAENPADGDCRVCGSLASLAGLEQALERNNAQLIENSIKRILLIHSIILAIGGVPLLYSGDEIGLLNDYDYQDDPTKQHDDRWVQRIAMNDALIKRSKTKGNAFYDIAQGLRIMIDLRKSNPLFGAASTEILQAENAHIFEFNRTIKNTHGHANSRLAICNFSEHKQTIDAKNLGGINTDSCVDLLSDTHYVELPNTLQLLPYQVMWLSGKA
jgi:amylosucrase